MILPWSILPVLGFLSCQQITLPVMGTAERLNGAEPWKNRLKSPAVAWMLSGYPEIALHDATEVLISYVYNLILKAPAATSPGPGPYPVAS